MSSDVLIAALYRFVRLDDFAEMRAPLLDFMLEHEIRGTLLLAHEGINGTVAGRASAVGHLLEYLRRDPRLRDLDCKFSRDEAMPFYRSRVKLKKEIVTMGIEDLDPSNGGQYVPPAEWNALIDDPAVTLIDTRNDYESAIGSFDHALHANTASFREFPEYARRHLDPKKQRKIAMFCTGGIRCEKSTAYLKQQGFEAVYHLQGGILKYLEEVPAEESRWHGECFVFDNRVSVNQALEKGSYDQCHACRRPITEADRQSAQYRPGVSCPHCFDEKSDAERRRFAEREKQVRLARERGAQHLGAEAEVEAKKRKRLKLTAKETQRKQAG